MEQVNGKRKNLVHIVFQSLPMWNCVGDVRIRNRKRQVLRHLATAIVVLVRFDRIPVSIKPVPDDPPGAFDLLASNAASQRVIQIR